MTAIDSSVLNSIGVSSQNTKKPAPQQLSQDDFLKLMTAQLKAQDPMKPLDNSEFVSQMAQFSTVSGIQSLQDSFSKLAASLQSSDMLQASSLVGHSVLVPGSGVSLPQSGSIQAAAELPASGNLVVDITDGSGQIVRHMDVGAQPAGIATFSWDGLDNTGTRLASGSYKLTARVVASDQSTQAASSFVVGQANSVSIGSDNTLSVDVQGVGVVPFSNIRQIL
jgi:flagellar basal-body rod modification protein FlgD